MQVTLPDGSKRQLANGATFLDLAKDIGPGLAKAAVAVKLDGELMDIQAPIPREGTVEILKNDRPESEEIIRHSAEHVLATAVVRLFKGAQVTMGPSDHSKEFYYDFDIGRPFSPDDIEKIEAEMKKIIAEDVKFVRREVTKAEAAELFKRLGQRFKPEILAWIPGDTVTIYEDADFIDLCRGPHIPSAGKIGAFKLTQVAAAYWRGDNTKDSLQRIRGVAFRDKKALDKYFADLERARARDHRKLGKELSLFGFSPLAPASPFFMPKGAIVYNGMIAYVRKLYERYGYEEVITPQVFNTELFKTSGHYENYADNMYFAKVGASDKSAPQESEEVKGVEWGLKPMNCPGHCLLYGMTLHSFRDLPWRCADFGRLHRAEGESVHGLMRVRTFCQDDAHIFCAEDQLLDESTAFIGLLDEVYGDFGFKVADIAVKLATRPDKRIGEDALWDRAEVSLAKALQARDRPYEVLPGEGAFYGPKIEFHVKDALDRSWQLGTLQVDFMMPERFGLEYVGHDSARHRPVMLHRAIFGSLERFFGVYLEHTGGAYPTWLAPVQAVLLPVTDRALAHAEALSHALFEAGVRVEVDRRNEKLGFKIREAQLSKVPFMLVVGDREVEQGGASVRLFGGEDRGYMPAAEIVTMIAKEAEIPGARRARVARASSLNSSGSRRE